MRGGTGVSILRLAIVALCVSAGVLIVLVALDTTPIADDYGDLPSIQHTGVFQYLHNYWIGLTDRYSNAVFMVVLVKLFGPAAIHIATPLLIALLLCFCVTGARTISASAQPICEAVVVGCLAAITVAASTPSIFDTLGWFNAVAIYLAGVVAAVGTTAWLAWLTVRSDSIAYRHAGVSFLVGLLAAGFTELTGTVIALGSLLAIANLRGVVRRGPRRRSLEIAYAAVAAGAAIGVTIIFAGPGSRARAHLQHGGFDLSLIATSARMNLGWANTNVGWRTLLSIAAGLSLLHLRAAPESQSALRWLLVWALFLCCVPILVVGAFAGYAGNTSPPLRAISVATASIAVGEGAIAYLVAAALVAAKPRLNSVLLPGAAVATAIGLVGFVAAATPVIRAELLRRTAVDARARSIRSQLFQHSRSVSVTPAPLIDVYANAYDLLFGRKRQLDYVLAGIRTYYEVPRNVAIQVIATQPRDYCLPHLSVTADGVTSCAQLAAKRRATHRRRLLSDRNSGRQTATSSFS